MKQKTTKCQYPDWEGGIVLGKHVFGKDGFCAVCGELRDVGHPTVGSEEPKTDFQKWAEAITELKEALMDSPSEKKADYYPRTIDIKLGDDMINKFGWRAVLWRTDIFINNIPILKTALLALTIATASLLVVIVALH